MFDLFKRKKKDTLEVENGLKNEVLTINDESENQTGKGETDNKNSSEEERRQKIENWKNQRKLKEEEWLKKEEESKRLKQESYLRQEEKENGQSNNHLVEPGEFRIFIGDVGWYDNKTQKYEDRSLHLMGDKILIGTNWGSFEEINLQGGSIYTVTIKKEPYFNFVTIKNESTFDFMATLTDKSEWKPIGKKLGQKLTQAELIKKHFDSLNEFVKQKKPKVTEEINSTYEIISNNTEIYELIYNYIDKTNRNIFLDVSNLVVFERILKVNYPFGANTLLIENEDFIKFNTFQNISDNMNESNLEEVNSYYNNIFLKLIKLLDRRINFNSTEESVFATWKMVRNIATRYFYDYFNSECSTYFKNIEELSLEECVSIFPRIDVIDINSVKNASIFTYYLMYRGKFNAEIENNFLKCHKLLIDKLLGVIKEKQIDDFEKALTNKQNNTNITISDIDLMSGSEFENFVGTIFSMMGYSVQVTKSSGDQGIDVIAEKNSIKIGIQAKCYSSAVSNKAIQEVVAGLSYYNLDKGIVVTNNYFTDSAKELAESNNIILWDRNMLKEKIAELF